MPGKILANILEKRLLYSTILLAISLFLGQAPMSIALVIWLISLPFAKIKTPGFKSWKEGLIYLPVVFGLVGFVISLILLKDLNQLWHLTKYLPFILIPIGMWVGREVWKEYSNLRILYLTYLSAALFTFFASLVYGLFRWWSSGNSIYITYNHLASLFGVQPIYLSLFYLLAILFALDLYFNEKDHRKIYLFTVPCLLLGIVLLASRSSLVIAVLILVIRFYMVAQNKRRFVLLLIVGLAAGITVIASIPTLRERIVNFDKNVASYSGTSFRFQIWENVLQVAERSPIWGYGLTNSQAVLQEQYEKVNFRRALLGEMNAHNQYLQTILDNGAIGLSILISMIFLPFTLKHQSFTAISFWIIIALSLITESFFRRQFGVIFYSLFYSIFMIMSTFSKRS